MDSDPGDNSRRCVLAFSGMSAMLFAFMRAAEADNPLKL